MATPASQNWSHTIKGDNFTLTISDSTVKRMEIGATSLYFNRELMHLALAHALEKSQRGREEDSYELHTFQQGTEEVPLIISYGGPTQAPCLNKLRVLAIPNGVKEPKWGVFCYDNETVAMAMPGGFCLYTWLGSFKSQMELATKPID